MHYLATHRNKHSGGFTLIEILVVIAIIGILLGFIVVGMSETRARARDGQRVTDLKTLEIALEQHYSERRTYPVELIDLVPDFIERVPKDPKTQADYDYELSTDSRDYGLMATSDDESMQCRVYSPGATEYAIHNGQNVPDCPFQNPSP